MKIKFLGTSAGWPIPRLGCDCTLCLSKNKKDKRTRSQLLVNDNFLLDVGPDTYNHLLAKGIDPRKIKYAAITHEHPDHVMGLWDLGHIYNSGKITIFLKETTFKKIRNFFFHKTFEVVFVEKEIEVENLVLNLLPVTHTDSSFAVFIKEKGNQKKLFYAPDFISLPTKTEKLIAEADIAIIDGSELNIKTPTHLPISEGLKLAKRLRFKKVYFTHLGHRTLAHSLLTAYVQKQGKEFFIPFDGLEVKIA